MQFLLLFLLLTFVFVLLLLGGSVFIQSWLYNVPADKIVYRALAAGAGLALFYTLWLAMDSSNPGKFDSVFESADLRIKDYDKIISIHKTKAKEEEIAYRKSSSGSKVEFAREGDPQKKWSRSDADGMVTAILIKEEGNDQPTRFEIKLDKNGKLPTETIYYEKDGNRYLDAPQLGRIVTPRAGSFFLRALISVLHFAFWLAALWLGMNFVFGHALGIGFAAWIFMTFAIMPVLFNKMRPDSSHQPSAVSFQQRKNTESPPIAMGGLWIADC